MKLTFDITRGNASFLQGELEVEEAELVIMPRRIEVITDKEVVLIFGRGGTNKEVHVKLIGDPTISRRHFKLEISPPKIHFKEFEGVANPTKINGISRIEDVLRNGDIIEVGYTKIKLTVKKNS